MLDMMVGEERRDDGCDRGSSEIGSVNDHHIADSENHYVKFNQYLVTLDFKLEVRLHNIFCL